MRIDASGYRRTLFLGLALAAALAAQPAHAQNRTYSLPVAVAPVQADAPLEPIAGGYGLWLRTRLREVGLEPIWSGQGASAEAVLASAAERGVGHALLPRLRQRGGEVEVQLLLYVPASRKLLAASRRRTGEGLRAVLRRVARAAGPLRAGRVDPSVARRAREQQPRPDGACRRTALPGVARRTGQALSHCDAAARADRGGSPAR